MPFSRNTGGFDNHGGGPDADFPDQKVNSKDRDLKLNQMLSVSWNFYIPFDFQVSDASHTTVPTASMDGCCRGRASAAIPSAATADRLAHGTPRVKASGRVMKPPSRLR